MLGKARTSISKLSELAHAFGILVDTEGRISTPPKPTPGGARRSQLLGDLYLSPH